MGIILSIISSEKIKLKYSLLIILIAIFLWSMFTLITTPYAFSKDRFIKAFFSLSVFLHFSFLLARSFARLHENYILLLVKKVFFGMIMISLVSLSLFMSGMTVLGSNYFPFSEPAHLARMYGVFLCLNMVINNSLKRKATYLILTLIFSGLFPSASLLIYCILAVLLLILAGEDKKKSKLIPLKIMVTLFFLVTFYTLVDRDYFLGRIDLSGNSNNLTSLVFFQGLEATKNILLETNYIGIGLHQMGNEPANYITEMISTIRSMPIGEGDLNRSDGGFVAAKLISEFGIFGLAIILYYIKTAVYCLLQLKKTMHTTHTKIAMTVIVSVAPEILIRGGGYFSASLLLMWASIQYLPKNSKSNMIAK